MSDDYRAYTPVIEVHERKYMLQQVVVKVLKGASPLPGALRQLAIHDAKLSYEVSGTAHLLGQRKGRHREGFSAFFMLTSCRSLEHATQ